MKQLFFIFSFMLCSAVMAQTKITVTNLSNKNDKELAMLVFDKKGHFLIPLENSQAELGTVMNDIASIAVWEEKYKDFASYLQKTNAPQQAVKTIIFVEIKKGAVLPKKYRF